LAGFVVTDPKANEAALKYYLLGSMFSALLILGISIFYSIFEGTTFKIIAENLPLMSQHPFYLFTGIILILSAFTFKAGLAPFHQWSPDVYEGAPTPVTAFMSVGPKVAAIGVMASFLTEALSQKPELWIGPLIFVALLTAAIGNILALRQVNLKRLLAYSSIAHAGYLLLAVIACSTSGLKAISFYALVYTFMNLGAFATLISFPQGERINAFLGLSQANLFLAISMLVFLFSLTGLPPFGGFVAKFFIFKSIIESGYTWVAVICILFSILSAYYYLRVGVKMFFYEGQISMPSTPLSLRLILVFTLSFTIILGIFPFLP
jgi:NADH-quinone oxidoreductase subunit N